MPPDPETIALRATVIGGQRYADDHGDVAQHARWQDHASTRPAAPCSAMAMDLQRLRQAGRWGGNGTDLDDCKAKFKIAWAQIRAGLTDADVAKAHEMGR